MANQKAMLKLIGPPGPNAQRDVRILLVDTDATASTFTDLGAASTWVADADYVMADMVGQGTTAPATATAFQWNKNGNDIGKFVNGAAVFDPKSTAAARLGAALGARIPKGTSLRLIGRA